MLKLDRSNIQSFCRTCLNCLQSAEESVTASSVKYNIRETPNLTKLLILCTTLNINEDADAAYPQQVCHKCYMSLLEIQRFRDLALQSNDVLRRVVENADAVVVTQNENSTQHEQLTRTKCEDFSNDHFEASQTELSESYFVIQEKEIEYDEFLDNSSEIKIEPAMFGDDSCVSPALSVAAKVIDCSADIVDDASTSTAGTSTAGTKRKRYLGPWECPVEDCGVEFDTKKALEKHSKYVHSAELPEHINLRHFIEKLSASTKKKITTRRCAVCCKTPDVRQETIYWCKDCDVGLCLVNCFRIYHSVQNL